MTDIYETYRGYDIKIGQTGRFFIYDKEGKQIYSMTAAIDKVYDWIDRYIRNCT